MMKHQDGMMHGAESTKRRLLAIQRVFFFCHGKTIQITHTPPTYIAHCSKHLLVAKRGFFLNSIRILGQGGSSCETTEDVQVRQREREKTFAEVKVSRS